MPEIRFNHMELTFPRGELNAPTRADITRFYGGVFGWDTDENIDTVGKSSFLINSGEGNFILLAESSKPISSPGYDHLGLLCETRAEVDELLEKCRKFQEQDPRVQIRDYDDLVFGGTTCRAFYVKYLLPIYFDVQALEYEPGSEPRRRWELVDG
jgi:hypothetical protein